MNEYRTDISIFRLFLRLLLLSLSFPLFRSFFSLISFYTLLNRRGGGRGIGRRNVGRWASRRWFRIETISILEASHQSSIERIEAIEEDSRASLEFDALSDQQERSSVST